MAPPHGATSAVAFGMTVVSDVPNPGLHTPRSSPMASMTYQAGLTTRGACRHKA